MQLLGKQVGICMLGEAKLEGRQFMPIFAMYKDEDGMPDVVEQLLCLGNAACM